MAAAVERAAAEGLGLAVEGLGEERAAGELRRGAAAAHTRARTSVVRPAASGSWKRATRRATRRAEEGGRREAAVWAWSRARRGAAYGQTKVLHVDQRLRARDTPHRGRLASAARAAKAERRRGGWRGVAAPQAAARAQRHGRRRLARPALPWARHSERASRPKRPLAHVEQIVRLAPMCAARVRRITLELAYHARFSTPRYD